MSDAVSTIFALSSGRPPAAIAVVRVSGPQARLALEKIAGRVPEPRRAGLVRLRDPTNGEVIDEGLVLWFPAPQSETGEDVAELQLHGGQAVIAGVLAALGQIPGCRLAEPGEFTRRAFENGRLDLTQVEGLADLVAAGSAAQRRQAYRQLRGLIGDRSEAWRKRLIEALALVEAQIDFSDEADVPENLLGDAMGRVLALRDDIAAALADGGRGERLRDGLVVAIVGPPNAGKSTLLNRLVRREAAIVSPHPGTTRDVIEVHLDIGGYPVTLLDTAGIRAGAEPVEEEGVRRARARAAEADLVLWVIDGSAKEPGAGAELRNHAGPPVWLLQNKADLCKPQEIEYGFEFILSFSALKDEGVDDLIQKLADFCAEHFAQAEASVVTRTRHRQLFEQVVGALNAALTEGARRGGAIELVAEELRTAATSLGRVSGRVDVEDILDVIFSEFCIGK